MERGWERSPVRASLVKKHYCRVRIKRLRTSKVCREAGQGVCFVSGNQAGGWQAWQSLDLAFAGIANLMAVSPKAKQSLLIS